MIVICLKLKTLLTNIFYKETHQDQISFFSNVASAFYKLPMRVKNNRKSLDKNLFIVNYIITSHVDNT